MHGARIEDEVQAGPGKPREEFRRQQISLEAVASCAREHDVARNVPSAVRERMHVIEGGEIELQLRATIDTAPPTVSHGGAFDRSFLMSGGDGFGPAIRPRGAGEGDTVKMPALGQ